MNFVKKINNNVALAQAVDGHEWIVLGKGIGFGKKAGDPLYSSEIEKRFIAEPSEQFSHVIQTVFQLNPDLLAVVMEVSQHAEQVLGCQFSNYQYLALLDHLHAALNQPQRKKEDIAYTLRWEVEDLYPKEYALATSAIDFLNDKLGVTLPESEVSFITMHFVNAQVSQEEPWSHTHLGYYVEKILTILADEHHVTFSMTSPTFRRFINHLRYFIIRQLNGYALPNHTTVDQVLLTTLQQSYPTSFQIANDLCHKLEVEEGWTIEQTDKIYLAMHLFRLLNDQ